LNRKIFYLVFCILGTVLPYTQFLPWLRDNGPDLEYFFMQLLQNRVSVFFGMDVFLSAVVLFFFVRTEGKRLKVRFWWMALIGTLLVGVSLGLPLFLYLRELSRERAGGDTVVAA
jgi:Terpene cyclase DEP1